MIYFHDPKPSRHISRINNIYIKVKKVNDHEIEDRGKGRLISYRFPARSWEFFNEKLGFTHFFS